VGKTTCKNFTSHLLRQKYRTHSTYNNYNNGIGVPHTILCAPKDTEALVIEAGMNHKGELSSLSECIKPDVAIITNVGTSHIGNLGSRRALIDAKCEILHGLSEGGYIIVPHESDIINAAKHKNRLTASCVNRMADFYLEKANEGEYDYYSPSYHKLRIECPLTESHVGECLLLALATAELLDLGEDEIRCGAATLCREHLRLKIIEKEGFTFIDDSYNASIESIISGIKTLLSYPADDHSVCIGDVLELGDFTEQIHTEIGKACATADIRLIFLHGNYSRFIYKGAVEAGFPKERIFMNEDVNDLGKTAKMMSCNLRRGEAVLLKASNKIGLGMLTSYI
jgi:UDP-N-acetylmuramoyl-tripeptide--D-alanyl-D-alanine ligase